MKFPMCTKLKEFCNRCIEKIQEEDSMVIGILWGDVGCGKSLLAQRIGITIDPTLDIARVCFDKDEFIRAVIDNKKKVIIADEGISLFFSRASMTKEGRLIAELMDQIRQKNLCVIICVPKLLSIDWLIRDKANFVGYVWESTKEVNGKNVTIKGNLAMYPRITGADFVGLITKYLIKKRNSLRSTKLPDPLFQQPGQPIGPTFKKPDYPVGNVKYRHKKEGILKKYKKPTKKDKVLEKAELIKMMKKNNPDLTDDIIAKSLNLSRQRVNTLKNMDVNLSGD